MLHCSGVIQGQLGNSTIVTCLRMGLFQLLCFVCSHPSDPQPSSFRSPRAGSLAVLLGVVQKQKILALQVLVHDTLGVNVDQGLLRGRHQAKTVADVKVGRHRLKPAHSNHRHESHWHRQLSNAMGFMAIITLVTTIRTFIAISLIICNFHNCFVLEHDTATYACTDIVHIELVKPQLLLTALLVAEHNRMQNVCM